MAGRRKQRGKKSHKGLIALGIIVFLVAAVYIGGAVYLKDKYLFKTSVSTGIAEVDASGKTAEEVKTEFQKIADQYQLTIHSREGITDVITAADIDRKVIFDGVQEPQTSPWKWPVALVKGNHEELTPTVVYDKDKLAQAIASMTCLDETKTKEPEDAYISDYIEGVGYEMVPEKENNHMLAEVVTPMIEQAVMDTDTEITEDDLEKADAYTHPEVYSDNEILNANLEKLNKIAHMTITHKFDDGKNVYTETLPGSRIAGWLVHDMEKGVRVRDAKVQEYIEELDKKYDTYGIGLARKFKTSWGRTITIRGGNYGWRLNQVDTKAELKKAIMAGEDCELEPIYLQRANRFGEQDYGDTYVEINITRQTVKVYQKGKNTYSCLCVTGREYDHATPSGVYFINYKKRDQQMVGQDYDVMTSYWMPFNLNIGMHDATWRSSFGGSIYKTVNGTHGCVNLPLASAKKIYGIVSAGWPVIVYRE